MGVSSVNSYQAPQINQHKQMQKSIQKQHEKLSSGKKVNRAADDPAVLAIIQKQLATTNGYQAGRDNLQSGLSASRIADAGMSGVTDYLQDIRELSLRASNGLMSQDDKVAIQNEIDQLKQGINDTVKQTKFNETDLLSSDSSISIATGGDASSSLSTVNASSATLGIENFSVLENFNIADLDNAMSKVSEARSKVGAEANGFEHSINSNDIAAENLAAATSRMQDTEYGAAISGLRQSQTMDSFRNMMQVQLQSNQQNQMMRIMNAV